MALEPAIEVRQNYCRRLRSGAWQIQWKVKNLGAHPLAILAVRFPHGQFRSPEREFALPYRLLPGESASLKADIACAEAPGTTVENAFLIMRALWLDNPWRVFARLRVTIAANGAPQAVTELITTQRAGFSANL